MKHLTTEQVQLICEWRLNRKPMTWAQVSAELGISTGRIRADRKTKDYLNTAFSYVSRYGYGMASWTLKQAGCTHPDTETLPDTWHAEGKKRELEQDNVTYNDGGRAAFDVIRDAPIGYVGDCAIRATATALNRDYGAVWQTMNAANVRKWGKSVDTGTYQDVSDAYMRDAGWVKLTLINHEDAACIALKLKGERAILGQAAHQIAVVDGKCHDTWNSIVTRDVVRDWDSPYIHAYRGEKRDNGDGTFTYLRDASVQYLYVAAERAEIVRLALWENLYDTPKPMPPAPHALPQNCEVKRYSDAYDLLMDEACERVVEDADPEDDDFIDALAETFDALCEERNITIVN